MRHQPNDLTNVLHPPVEIAVVNGLSIAIPNPVGCHFTPRVAVLAINGHSAVS